MKAIIIDFDGTLADSFDHILVFLLKQAGRTTDSITAEERQALKGLSMKDLAVRVGVPYWKLPFVYFRGKTYMTKRMQNVVPFRGMEKALAALHAEGYPLFIVSSNSRSNISRFLAEHGLDGYFHKVYGNAGWFNKGRALRQVLKRNKLQADDSVYVGDEVRDVIGAQLAGIASVAVTWGFASEAALLAHAPTIVVRKTSQLQKSLLNWAHN